MANKYDWRFWRDEADLFPQSVRVRLLLGTLGALIGFLVLFLMPKGDVLGMDEVFVKVACVVGILVVFPLYLAWEMFHKGDAAGRKLKQDADDAQDDLRKGEEELARTLQKQEQAIKDGIAPFEQSAKQMEIERVRLEEKLADRDTRISDLERQLRTLESAKDSEAELAKRTHDDLRAKNEGLRNQISELEHKLRVNIKLLDKTDVDEVNGVHRVWVRNESDRRVAGNVSVEDCDFFTITSLKHLHAARRGQIYIRFEPHEELPIELFIEGENEIWLCPQPAKKSMLIPKDKCVGRIMLSSSAEGLFDRKWYDVSVGRDRKLTVAPSACD